MSGGTACVPLAALSFAFGPAPLSPGFPLWMNRIKADSWQFHIPNPTGDVSYLLTRPRGKVVATYHSDVVRQKWAMSLYGPLLRSFLRRCDMVLPTSPRLVKHSPVLRHFRKKCRPVPLGMPLEKYKPAPESAREARAIKNQYKGFPLLVFVGKLRYYKGLQFLVSALRSLPHVQLAIIGEGPEGPKLKRLAEEFQLTDRIDFLGELSDERMIAYLHAADIFAMPSHLPSEAYGLSQIEAMATGTPVVSCNLPTGVPYVNRDGETGLIVPPGDEDALAEALQKLLDDTNLRFRLGEAAFRRAHENFASEVMVNRLQSIYTKLL